MQTEPPQYDAHVRALRELQQRIERARERGARYRIENNNIDGRPRVDRLGDDYDPLLDALIRKHGKHPISKGE